MATQNEECNTETPVQVSETEPVQENSLSEQKQESSVDKENDLEANDLEQKIIKQVEYYFGDANLPRDKFMLEQVKLDNGWIPMSTMLKFQRLSRLSSNVDAIVKALKFSQLIEIDSSGSEPKIRRSPEMPLPEFNEERRKLIMDRTVYLKGFPVDSDMDAVMAVINSHCSPEQILMRKYKDKSTQTYIFKGSIFVIFKTLDEAKAFLEKDAIKVGEKDLIKMWQNDYVKMKKIEAEGRDQKRSHKNADRVKKEKENLKIDEFKKGATIHLSGDFGEIARKDIQETLNGLGIEPQFINYNKGDKEAFVRLVEENSANAAVEKMTDQFSVKDSKMTVRVLEGEEEAAYLIQAGKEKKAFMQKYNKKGNKKSYTFKRRGSRRNDGDGEPPKKKVPV